MSIKINSIHIGVSTFASHTSPSTGQSLQKSLQSQCKGSSQQSVVAKKLLLNGQESTSNPLLHLNTITLIAGQTRY